MDPLSAIGLAANVLAFVDFASKLVAGAHELQHSANGITTENLHIKNVIADLCDTTNALPSTGKASSQHERALQKLASDCIGLSDKLTAILNEMEVAGKKSLFRSIRAAMESMRKREDVLAIESRLSEYRSQIVMRLVMMLGSLSTRVNANTLPARISKISTSLEDLRGMLLKLQSSIVDITAEKSTLNNLKFNSMFDREDDIRDPGAHTFEWMLGGVNTDDPTVTDTGSSYANVGQDEFDAEHMYEQKVRTLLADEHSKREAARSAFQSWLRERGSVFHISGKAGSGKSTLMKYLCNHTHAQNLLRGWAKDKKLILGKFYFWNSRTKIQASKEGLFRALLFEVLKQAPELIPELFPEAWAHFRGARGDSSAETTMFRPAKIRAAFETFLSRQGQYPNHRFCFFLDGLDEYSDHHADRLEQRGLALSIKRWACRKDVKLCVSSRPHVEILDSFSASSDSRIHLHELTRSDIYLYAATTLRQDLSFDWMEGIYWHLVLGIIRQAEGVLLWACMIIRLLLISAARRDSPEDMWRLLSSTPSDLNRLYDRLFDTLPTRDRIRVDQMLLITAQNPEWDPPNALVYTWLEDLERDPEFPCNCKFEQFSETEVAERLHRLRLQLDSYTHGMLEIVERAPYDLYHRSSSPGPTDRFFLQRVQFIHRTLKDFVLTKADRDELPGGSLIQQSPDVFVRLRLAEAVFLLDNRPGVWSEAQSFSPQDYFSPLQLYQSRHFSTEFLWHYERIVAQHMALRDIRVWWDGFGYHTLASETLPSLSVAHFAAYIGQTAYVFQNINDNVGLLDSQGDLNLLLSAIVGKLDAKKVHLVLRLLLAGASIHSSLMVLVDPRDMEDVESVGDEEGIRDMHSMAVTPCEVLADALGDIWWNHWRRRKYTNPYQWKERPQVVFLCQILEHFLLRGMRGENCSFRCQRDKEYVESVSLEQVVVLCAPPNLATLLPYFRRPPPSSFGYFKRGVDWVLGLSRWRQQDTGATVAHEAELLGACGTDALPTCIQREYHPVEGKPWHTPWIKEMHVGTRKIPMRFDVRIC
ncbi:uncharacterized protein LTR77_001869 [Saxophila tyrrhenica]|uniref:NACHT domain-containing protein n=1 Tax=Saxophila tyrrhenica TaxID=1690608 RepID=A0AAV9PPF6_9PEZI|nr:hypothetical protein LTR77_001869 [Saxophila tyrrhenica]